MVVQKPGNKKNAFQKHLSQQKANEYTVATESMSVAEKMDVLERLGRPELVDLFKDWKPRVSHKKKRGAPLDQRVSIAVTDQERITLDQEIKAIKEVGEGISISQFIRNRALGNIDINGWKNIAEKALEEIEDTAKNQGKLRKEKVNLALLIEEIEDDDPESATRYSLKINEITHRLKKIVAQNEKRNNRLSGRMSMVEAETIKWRAQRLCISSSDYLRMLIFNLSPNSSADSHMSLDAKRRFYISIMDVADKGWGTPPEIYECSQCINYMEEIKRLKDENEQLRNFA